MYIKPKKSLGQNFLIDKNIQKKIISACDLVSDDIVLEIGSGRGELTSQLALTAKQVFALEIDRRLYPALRRNLECFANCRIVESDILKFDLSRFLRVNKITGKIKVIGNLPYYISSPIIEHLIRYRGDIEIIFITVQKEFGRRVKAVPRSKDYGSFSCFTQYYLKPKIIFEIKRNSFSPAPKVDSSFLSLKVRETPEVLVNDEERFFKLIRKAFNQRRKTLRNSLDGFMAEDTLEAFFYKYGIDRNVRPEELSLPQFANLSNL